MIITHRAHDNALTLQSIVTDPIARQEPGIYYLHDWHPPDLATTKKDEVSP